jgi:hypothetical protein
MSSLVSGTGMTLSPPTAREWFSTFRNRYLVAVHGDALSEPLAMHNDKLRLEEDWVRTDEFDPYRSREWTAEFIVFLGRFARALGMYQELEYPVDGTSTELKVDIAWLAAWNRTGSPLVAIESENDSGTDIVEGEVRNLLGTSASLRVLITYPYGKRASKHTRAGILNRVTTALSNGRSGDLARAEFLLVLGGEQDEGLLKRRDISDWSAYLWNTPERKFEPV